MPLSIDENEAHARFDQLLELVAQSDEIFLIQRQGQPVVALVSGRRYERLIAAREARFAVLDDIRARLPNFSEDTVSRDVAEALAAIRRPSRQ